MKTITILLVILLVFPSVYGDLFSDFCFNSINKIPVELNSVQPSNYTLQMGNEQKVVFVDGSTFVDVFFKPKRIGDYLIKIKVLETGEVIKKEINVNQCVSLDIPKTVNVNSSSFPVKIKNVGEATTIRIHSQPFSSNSSSLTIEKNETKLFNIALPNNVNNKKIKESIFIKIDDYTIKKDVVFIFGNPIKYIYFGIPIFLLLLFLFFIFLNNSKPIVSKKNKKLIKKINEKLLF